MPDIVNPQVTDAVTQSNVKVIGEAPAESIAMLYQMSTSAAGLSIQNAVAQQQQMNAISQAATTQAVNKLLNVDTEEAISMLKANSGNEVASQISSLMAALSSNQQGAKVAQSTPPETAIPG